MNNFYRTIVINQLFWAILVIGLLVNNSVFSQSYPPPGTVKIMPLGNSITQGRGGDDRVPYRRDLWHLLQDNNQRDVDFIGSMKNLYSPLSTDYTDYDLDHEGHWGWRASEILNGPAGTMPTGSGSGKLSVWLQTHVPDAVLMHVGSNEMIKYVESDGDLLDYYSSTQQTLRDIIAELRSSNPDVFIFLAQLVPSKRSAENLRIKEFNKYIADLAAELDMPYPRVILIDQYSGINAKTDLYDNYHPNAIGAAKMANTWYKKLSLYLDGNLPAYDGHRFGVMLAQKTPLVKGEEFAVSITNAKNSNSKALLNGSYHVDIKSSFPSAGTPVYNGPVTFTNGSAIFPVVLYDAGTHHLEFQVEGITSMESLQNLYIQDINTYTLTYLAGANGSITGTAVQTVNYGSDGEQVTAVANKGYHFVQWSDGVTTASRKDENITADLSVTATFAINTYTLTYLAAVNGSITGTAIQTVNHGSDGAMVTAVANTGYHFVQWSDGVTTASRKDENITADLSVTASFAINTYTLTYLAAANGSITGTAVQTVNQGSSGTQVTAVANTGYHFVQWSDGVTTASRKDENITADLSVTATFAISTYTLTYLAAANGSVTGNTVQTVNYGSSGTQVTAVANEGYYFAGWSDGSLLNPRTDSNVSGDITVTASFSPTDKYSVNLISNPSIAGVLSGHGEYADGTKVTVSAVANTGYTFINWTINGVEVSQQEKYSFLVTQDITLTANFSLMTYTLTYMADANGSITGSTVQTVNHGGSGTQVTAVANEGYHFVQWSDGLTTASRKDENITADLSVTANFAINSTYTLTIYVEGNGHVTVNGLVYTEPVTIPANTVLTIRAIADKKNSFKGWSGHLVSKKTTEKILMNEDKILYATFTSNISSSQVTIYPNPFNDQLSLNASEISRVTITDMTGKQVLRVESPGEDALYIRTADLVPGVYFLTIETNSGERLIRKVVKSQ
jgi:lysophospholipase L1-like esterase/ribosome-associated toxin RatA of RatAB toxin-antitoxin module